MTGHPQLGSSGITEPSVGYQISKVIPSGMLLPARILLLKGPQPSKTAPLSGTKYSNTWSYGGHFTFQNTMDNLE